MKNGLLLTLKELIKLGVIKIKKKKRRNPLGSGSGSSRRAYQKTQNSPFTKGDSVNPIDIQGMGGQRYKEFLSASSAPNPQAYSDALRLRDENNNFNTRLLEYKNQQQEQKLLLEDQQQQQQQLQQIQQRQQLDITQGIPIVNDLITRTSAIEAQRAPGLSRGFVDDDSVDVIETFGSENFKTQQDIADPELRQPPPSEQPPSEQPQLLLTNSLEDEYEDIPVEKIKTRRYITKRIKSLIQEKLQKFPDMTEEKAKEIVLMETRTVPKQKRPKGTGFNIVKKTS